MDEQSPADAAFGVNTIAISCTTHAIAAAMIGATDSRHFEAISDHIYRFSQMRAKPDDLARFHGTNERITVANLGELIRFDHRLVSQAAGA